MRDRIAELESAISAEREKYSEWHKEALLRSATIHTLVDALKLAREVFQRNDFNTVVIDAALAADSGAKPVLKRLL